MNAHPVSCERVLRNEATHLEHSPLHLLIFFLPHVLGDLQDESDLTLLLALLKGCFNVGLNTLLVIHL